MRFGRAQRMKFKTKNGAYSVVTDRENYDSQITLTDYEADMAISYFGINNIHVGPVRSNRSLSLKTFLLYPNGNEVALNFVYPKPDKPELRLYISSSAGFKPDTGDVWFMFVKDGRIWIGSMAETAWRNETSLLKHDECDESYQIAIHEKDEIRISRLNERDIYSRDRSIAIERITMAEYSCEYDSNHSVFTSRFSRKPYLEAHHLVPIGAQKELAKSVDTVENVFCLCPFCHRAVHHAEESLARQILRTLTFKRPVLETFSLSVNDLFGLYSVEEID